MVKQLNILVMVCLLFAGTSATAGPYTAIILHPSGFDYSYALSVSGGQQVGSGAGSATGGQEHALLWSGTAESYIDLHSFLPEGYISSIACGIDSAGNIVGYAYPTVGGGPHAVLWIPAPGAIILGSIGAGLVGWLRRRRLI